MILEPQWYMFWRQIILICFREYKFDFVNTASTSCPSEFQSAFASKTPFKLGFKESTNKRQSSGYVQRPVTASRAQHYYRKDAQIPFGVDGKNEKKIIVEHFCHSESHRQQSRKANMSIVDQIKCNYIF